MSKQLLLGDEAIAQAALDAGLSGVYAYPGTPSTEITEYIQMAPITAEKNIHNRWCSNEKTCPSEANSSGQWAKCGAGRPSSR